MTEASIHNTLFKTDSTGNMRVWWMESQLDGRYRSVSGIEGGTMVYGEWTQAEPKNVGRSNETTAGQQALLEVESQYAKKLKEYHEQRSTAHLPKFVEPMTAKTWESIDQVDGETMVAVQPKLDGIRCVVGPDGAYARSGDKIITVPHIEQLLVPIAREHGVIFDGELYNHKFRDNFNAIISLVKRKKPTDEDFTASAQDVQYHIYDMMLVNEPNMPFDQRLANASYLIRELVPGGQIQQVETSFVSVDAEQIDRIHRSNRAQGYEGSMVRTMGPYEHKRSKHLMKYKDWQDAEWTILDIEQGKGKWAGKAKAVHFEHNGKAFKATLVGTMEQNEQVYNQRAQLIGCLATVKFQEMTPDGAPRFGNVIKIHEGGKI